MPRRHPSLDTYDPYACDKATRATLNRAGKCIRWFLSPLLKCFIATDAGCTYFERAAKDLLCHHACSYACSCLAPCCYHGYGHHATKKLCFVCCRCRKVFNTLGDVDAHCYLEYIELFGRDTSPWQGTYWKCFGCLRNFADCEAYAGHFGKAMLKIGPEENPTFLNLL